MTLCSSYSLADRSHAVAPCVQSTEGYVGVDHYRWRMRTFIARVLNTGLDKYPKLNDRVIVKHVTSTLRLQPVHLLGKYSEGTCLTSTLRVLA